MTSPLLLILAGLALICFAVAVLRGSWPLFLGGYGLAAAALVAAFLQTG